MNIRAFEPSDHPDVLRLWQTTPGIVVRDVDAGAPIAAYLAKNPGMSFVAVVDDHIVGAVLCGTDGRRGYLQHLAVHPDYRRQGLGRRLVQRCLDALAAAGVDKCHLMVLADNRDAAEYWTHLGWELRSDLHLMSHTISGVPGA